LLAATTEPEAVATALNLAHEQGIKQRSTFDV
jgi:hypothetical protein